MKNILYIGPYRQSDEWGNIAKGMVRVLMEQDINLAIRPVWFNAEKKSSETIDFLKPYESVMITENKNVLIQHGLPNFLNPDHTFDTNIAIASINSVIGNMDWPYHLNLFDLVVVFSEYEKEMLIKSGVDENKITAAPFPPLFMTEEPIEFQLNLKGLKFYTDAGFDETSGLEDIVTSYLSEFSILDEVLLVLVPKEGIEHSKQKIEKLKQGLGIFKDYNRYANIVLIDGKGRSCMNALNQQCDSFIHCPYNATVSQNLLKSVFCNKIPIVLDTVASLGLRWPHCVDSYEDVCMHEHRPVTGLFCGQFTWKKPLRTSLKQEMRRLYCVYKDSAMAKEEEQVALLKSQLNHDWSFLCS